MSSLKRALRQFTFGAGKTAGRNTSGRITSFHRGGGAKRLQRIVDLKRNAAPSSMGVVERIEYDPNRSSNIALIRWVDGVHRHRVAAAEKSSAAPQPRKPLEIDSAAANISGVFPLNSILPPEHAGKAAREVFLSAFSPNPSASESKRGSGSALSLPRIAVAAARAAFFAPRVKGEETLQVQNWKKNSDAWTHRNKRKAAISWHSIAR